MDGGEKGMGGGNGSVEEKGGTGVEEHRTLPE
jgi:hypothetical protein